MDQPFFQLKKWEFCWDVDNVVSSWLKISRLHRKRLDIGRIKKKSPRDTRLFQSSIRLHQSPRREKKQKKLPHGKFNFLFASFFLVSCVIHESRFRSLGFPVYAFRGLLVFRVAPGRAFGVPYGAAGETGKCWAAPPWWPSVNFRFRHSRNDVTSDPPRLLGLLPLVAFPCFNFSRVFQGLWRATKAGEKKPQRSGSSTVVPQPTPPLSISCAAEYWA